MILLKTGFIQKLLNPELVIFVRRHFPKWTQPERYKTQFKIMCCVHSTYILVNTQSGFVKPPFPSDLMIHRRLPNREATGIIATASDILIPPLIVSVSWSIRHRTCFWIASEARTSCTSKYWHDYFSMQTRYCRRSSNWLGKFIFLSTSGEYYK